LGLVDTGNRLIHHAHLEIVYYGSGQWGMMINLGCFWQAESSTMDSTLALSGSPPLQRCVM